MIFIFLFYNFVSLHKVLDDRHGSKRRNKFSTYNKVNMTNKDLKRFLRNELNEVLPFIGDHLDNRLKNRNVDLNNYRDIFMISKHVHQKGGKRMIEYTINEKIVPRTDRLEMPAEKEGNHLAIALCISIMFLAGLGYILFIKMVKSYKLLEFIQAKN